MLVLGVNYTLVGIFKQIIRSVAKVKALGGAVLCIVNDGIKQGLTIGALNTHRLVFLAVGVVKRYFCGVISKSARARVDGNMVIAHCAPRLNVGMTRNAQLKLDINL